jgi:toxin ParE1/3/4
VRTVIWSTTARTDYLGILRYIAADDPDAADRVLDAIEATGNGLGAFATGHPGRVSGTYEKSVRRLPYIIAYALSGDGQNVVILRIIHSARDWQSDTWPE